MKFSPSNISEKKPWDIDVQFLKGVGEKIAAALKKADIQTFWDFLFLLPRYYEDRRKNHSWAEVVNLATQNKVASGKIRVSQIISRKAGRSGRRWTEVLCDWVETDKIEIDSKIVLLFFSQFGLPFEKQFPVGTEVLFRGKVQYFRGRIQSTHPELQDVTKGWPEYEKGIVPVYSEVSGLPNRLLRRIFAAALDRAELKVLPNMEYESSEFKNLPTLSQALTQVHRPTLWQPLPGVDDPNGDFYKKLIFDELYLTSLALLMRKRQWKAGALSGVSSASPRIQIAQEKMDSYIKNLPYELTSDQAKVLQEISEDLSLNKEPVSMHRLVQGDVGSGKTIVAFLSGIAALESGYQVAMMAPTEILATQHYANFVKLFPGLASQCCLLKGSLKASEKSKLRKQIELGEFKFVIGTQALIAEGTRFSNLGLVVIDEQHRFGVAQRWGLTTRMGKEYKIQPHLLVMTATPIPRSLALTLYGDLNLSQIRTKPKGRIPIETHFVSEKLREALDRRLLKFLGENRQIYCVFPLIEESEELDIQNAEDAFERLQKVFSGYKIGLLHGRMKNKEKDLVMEKFRSGEIQVLVSTTVIEVGVDVPNASVIVIENCDRFGLSQLHQLRGRVGRGAEKSYCVLVAPEKVSPFAKDRIEVMTQSEDGFVISEKDLELRGPGEFLGEKQSGLPGFRLVHLLRDREILEKAREEAERVINLDPELKSTQNRSSLELMDVWWGRGRNPLSYQISG